MRVAGFHRGRVIEIHDGDSNDQTDFRYDVKDFCSAGAHNLVGFFGPKNGFLNTEELTKQYEEMWSFFSSADTRAALILIPDSAHLADDIHILVKRLIQMYDLECEIRCVYSDLPDPLQDSLAKLPVSTQFHDSRIIDTKRVIEKAAHGEVLGKTPYGYVANAQGKAVPEPHEAKLVKLLFTLYTEGMDERGPLGLRLIAQHLNQKGLFTRQGRSWSQVTISGILKNRVYLGTYNRYGVRIVGNHEPLISRDIFRKADKIINERSPIRSARNLSPFLLSGLAVCATCNRNLVGVTRRRTWKQENGSSQSRSYRYYECPARSVASERAGEKKHAAWQAAKLETSVVGELHRLFREVGRDFITIAKNSAPDLKAELISAEKKFVRLLRDVAEGHGRVGDLKLPLHDLEILQTSPSISFPVATKEFPIDQLVDESFTQDFETARATLTTFLEAASASVRKVKIRLKKNTQTHH